MYYNVRLNNFKTGSHSEFTDFFEGDLIWGAQYVDVLAAPQIPALTQANNIDKSWLAPAAEGPVFNTPIDAFLPIAHFNLRSLDGTNGFIIHGNYGGQKVGSTVSDIGDFNGDGFDDLLISQRHLALQSGGAFILYGTAAGFPAEGSFNTEFASHVDTISSSTSNFATSIGAVVSGAGDFNGDGYDDILLSSYGAPTFSAATGVVYLVLGGPSSGGNSLSLVPNSTDGSMMAINGIAVNDITGRRIDSVGDINGDGFDDIIIGAQQAYNSSGVQTGRAYVLYGSSAALAPSLDLANLDGTNGFYIDGLGLGEGMGFTVSGLGDINDDGLDDFAVSSFTGFTYMVFGAAAGFGTNLDLSTLNGTNGFTLSTPDGADNGQFGTEVSSAGDVNGDGIDDLLIVDRALDIGSQDAAGNAYIVFGRNTGFNSTIDLSTLNGTDGFVVRGFGPADYDFSYMSISGAGDLDGDGLDDFIIGLPLISTNPDYDTGAAYVVFGHALGYNGELLLSALDGSNGFAIHGLPSNRSSTTAFAASVSGAGDLNGDGYADLVIGAYNDNFVNTSGSSFSPSGSAYVIYGGPELRRSVVNLTNAGDTYTLGAGETLYALIGNDIITGSSSNDLVDAGVGDDRVNGLGGHDTLYGGAGNDILTGGAGADELFGGLDNDTLSGNDGNDTLDGGAGNDNLNGGAGADILDGGAGNDRASYSSAALGVIADLEFADNNTRDALGDTYISIEALEGSQHNDSLRGDANNNTLFGRDGNDNLFGRGGNDALYGGAGDDTLNGGAGNDILYGGVGADVLIGGTGIDTASYITSAAGVVFSTAAGGTGGDAAGDTYSGIERFYGSGHNDQITGGASADFLNGLAGDDIINGEGGADRLYGSAGNDTINGGAGNDLLIGGAGADVLNGGTGLDRAVYTSSAVGIIINLANAALSTGEASGDTYISVEWIQGSTHDDTFVGGGNANVLFGLAGNDTIDGGGGNDRLYGGDGNDTVNGGDGADLIYGNGGSDILNGGTGNDLFFASLGGDTYNDTSGTLDTIFYFQSSAAVNVDLVNGGTGGFAQGDSYSGIERIIGSFYDDTILGGAANETFFGGNGDDILNGRAGNDRLTGGNGDDTFQFDTGLSGSNTIFDFTAGAGSVDAIEILGGDPAFDSFAELMAIASEVVISGVTAVRLNFGGGSLVTIRGTTISDLHEDDFIFTSAAEESVLDKNPLLVSEFLQEQIPEEFDPFDVDFF